MKSKKTIATMKNIFKSLMFVAVAAMTFTACTEENNEVNAVSKQSVLKFETTFDETRVTIGDKDGDYYPLTWDGDETVLFDIQDGGWWTNQNSNITVDEDNTANATFEVVFDSYAAGASADEGSTIYARLGKIYSNFALGIAFETQTPTATSVDKSFITMMAEFPVEVEGQMVFNGRFEHKAAYGVVTLPAAVNDVDFKSITVKVNGAKTYTLNVEGLDTHSYWFACEPEAVNSLDVTGVASDDTVYKYTAEGLEKEFKAGVISKFSLKKFEATKDYYLSAYWYNQTNEFLLNVRETATDNVIVSIDGFAEDNTILKEGTYTVVNTYEQNAFNIIGGWCSLSSGTVVVEYLEVGYNIEINVVGTNGTTYSYSWAGPVVAEDAFGFFNPGDPIRLADPEEVTATANGTTINVSWTAVEGAENYTVEIYTEGWDSYYMPVKNIAETATVDELEYTSTVALEPMTSYNVSVKANTTAEGYTSSLGKVVYAQTAISKDAKGTEGLNYVYTSYTNNGNIYKFTDATGNWLSVEFNQDIMALDNGSYTFKLYDDITYSADSSFYIVGNEQSSYYPSWWLQGTVAVFFDKSDAGFELTVFCKRNVNGYDGEPLYKGYYKSF